MGKDRLKRILIILLVAILVAGGVKVFADWQKKQKDKGQILSLPTQQIGEKIADLGEQVLGKAIEIVPGGSGLKEKLKAKTTPTPTTSQTTPETVVQTERVETKTQEIIEMIKELSAAELENIKKQFFKDFCQEILKEE